MIKSQPFDCKASVHTLHKMFPSLCCCGVRLYKVRFRFWSVYIYVSFSFPSLFSASLSLFICISHFFSPPSFSLSLPATTNLDSESKRAVHFQSSWQQHVNVFGSWSRPECVQELHQEAQLNLQSILQGRRVSCRLCACVFWYHERSCRWFVGSHCTIVLWILCFHFFCMWVCVYVCEFPPLPFPVRVSQSVYKRLYLSFCSSEHPLVFPLLSLSVLSISESYFCSWSI